MQYINKENANYPSVWTNYTSPTILYKTELCVVGTIPMFTRDEWYSLQEYTESEEVVNIRLEMCDIVFKSMRKVEK